MLNVGLLGAGRIGQVHAASIARHGGSTLAAVSDVHAPSAEALGQTYGVAVRSSDDILADPSIDAVLIASSTDTHCDLIEAGAAAGKAVLCEKPVDLSLDRARACAARVAGTTSPIMIGFNRRFDRSFAAAKTSADGGEIGQIELLSITSFDPAPPPIAYIKVSGGLFRDMMIHDFDMACWMMGGAPQSIMAVGSSLVDPAIGAEGDVDTAVATLTWADGRIAVIKNSRRAAYGYDQRLELLGSEGLLQVGNVNETTVTRSTADGAVGAKPTYFFLERYMPAYESEWAAFVEAATGGAPNPVPLADGVRALALAEAATQSAKSGLPVKLDTVLGEET